VPSPPVVVPGAVDPPFVKLASIDLVPVIIRVA
jgi:hypothetical protein